MIILGIESCLHDEDAAALVEDGRRLLGNVISTSVKERALFTAALCPEIASITPPLRICNCCRQKAALLDAGRTHRRWMPCTS